MAATESFPVFRPAIERRRRCLAPLIVMPLVCGASLLPNQALAGGTPATGTVADELIMITGSESKTEDGDYLTANDGLEGFHSFFVEVPAGATSLEVDIYDLDILYGIEDGTNTEQVAERDRIRRYELFLADQVLNFNDRVGASIAKYELYDPSGTRVTTKYIYGSHFAPGNADGAWLNFYDSDLADVSGGDQFLDQFSSSSFSNNDGAVNFAGDWMEDEQSGVRACNTGAGAGAGLIRVTGGRLRMTDDCDFSPDMGREPSIYREADLTAYNSAVLSFDFEVSRQTEKPDGAVLEISTDGGTSYTIIDAFTGYDGADVTGSRSYDISDYTGGTARIRFRFEYLFAGSSEYLYIDNFQILATANAAAAPTAGHWEIRVDMSSTVNDIGGLLNGDETNAFGIRAHDGDETAGGTEYNVYTNHYTTGINPNDSGRDYTLYPYITSGCDFSVNDFDWDADLPSNTAPTPNIDPPFGSLTVTSPDTLFSSASTLSDNNVWAGNTATGFIPSNQEVDGYGVWTMAARVEDPVDGNYAPIYIGTYEDLDVTPAVIPDPESFRIYLPRDGGGAPIKPYLTQRLTVFATQPFGGSDPPATGETTRYAVSVVVRSPDGTAGDLSFDGLTRLVTAHLPGGDVTYQGVGFVTQGSIVSEPTVGSNTAGDLTWNPGTVTAGSGSESTATLAYIIDVTGPVAPYTVDATPAPGSGNGTRATWVDETGNRDYSTGELCQLQVINAVTTPVVLDEMSAAVVDGRVAVQWTTASESGAASYDLYRVTGPDGSSEKVNQEPLTPWIGSAAGGSYRVIDAGADPGAPSTYWLVETDSRGQTAAFGPYPITPDAASLSLADLPVLQPTAPDLPTIDRLLAASEARSAEKRDGPASQGPVKTTADAVKILVTETGMQRVLAADLAPLVGLSEAQVLETLGRRGYRLSREGQDIAFFPTPQRDGFVFYGQAADTPYTDTAVYRLEPGKGTMMRRVRSRSVSDWQDESFDESIWIERNQRPVVLLDLDPEGDNWFWDFVRFQGGDNEQLDFVGSLPDVDPGAERDAAVEVFLQGGGLGDHSVELNWNGQNLGQVNLKDIETRSVRFALETPWLSDGDNTLQMRGTAGNLVFLEGYRVDYRRRALAAADRLELPARRNRITTVGGFTDPGIQVYDVTNPQRPSVVLRPTILPEGAGYRAVVSLRGGAETRRLATVAPDGLLSPALLADQPSNLLTVDHSADYVIIAAPELLASAADLAAYRQSPSRSTLVVSLEDIYDEFAHGMDDPRAIRDFLAHAWSTWTTKPSMAVLLGHGTYDFRDHWGLGDNLLPALLTAQPGSLFPTDALYGDVEGDDGSPEIVVGRIPALTNAEAADYLAKLQAYEALGDTSWNHRVLGVADTADSAGDFQSDLDRQMALVGFGYESLRLNLDEQADVATGRSVLFDALAAGVGLMHYGGHGAIHRLADESLLTSADVAGLGTADRPTVLTAATCNIGLHAFPGFDSLSETLLLESDRGAVAAFAPSWLVENQDGGFVTDRLFRQIFIENQRTLGTAVQEALYRAAAYGVPAEVLRSFQLLGDPALQLQLHQELPPPGCTSNCGNG